MHTALLRRCTSRTPEGHDVGRFSLRALAGLLHVRWQPDLVIDRTDITLAAAAIQARGGPNLPLLVEVCGLREITRDARDAILAYRHSPRIAILGSDAVDLVLTAFAVRSPIETRFFTDRDEAVGWLLQG
ncbi:hypothetical protein FDK12_09315 [Arthrobacter sp. NamB2]|uniref:DUF7793 family protein n=1 Tax=Arthrobacter sp. NamB2 TaxID=2576035 RepID=UPI0010CA0C63|nr:hypothetical protein [Arthrobacter sp. NamB2]TKV28159.1 hypothetical protein FDK12_09315 [Arthrobacter sp. NamB2]